ncbi:MAG: glycosyltransferase [Rhodoglobus sp.]
MGESSAQDRTSFAVIVEHGEVEEAELDSLTIASVQQQHSPADVVHVVEGASTRDLTLTADFVIFVRSGDTLDPEAMRLIAAAHRADPALELICFDSDVRDAAQGRHDPLFRPEWSPEMLLGANYIGRAFAIKRTRLSALTVAVDSRGLWQLLLESAFDARMVGRVSRVLLTERVRYAGAAVAADAEMVAVALANRGIAATVTVRDSIVCVQRIASQWPTVSIVIPTRHSRSNLARLLPSLATTDYPHFGVTIADNGEQTPENVQWYADAPLPVSVTWSTETPFNYSRTNNAMVAATTGDVVVLLNDDTEIVDPTWLSQLVGLLQDPGIGCVGLQHRRGDGRIQHGGVTLGPGGFADNLFSGLEPGSNTLLGSTRWYRNTLAVTGACVALTRKHFDEVGGLDERFQLTGSDVVLGLDQVIRGRRNVVIPFDMVRHYESVTRGHAPRADSFASYWRYQPWLQAGDPYSSPNVSRTSAIPMLPLNSEPTSMSLAMAGLGREYSTEPHIESFSRDGAALVIPASVSRELVDSIAATHADNAGFRQVSTVNWFIPDIDIPFFGGINTTLRIAEKLSRENGVVNRFVVLAPPNEEFFLSALEAAFPALAGSEVVFYDGSDDQIATIPGADAAVATLWLTAVHVAKSAGVERKFYLMQDYEPGFYPASTLFALAEETYKLGLYAICNTESMFTTYTQEYGGKAMFFTPAVDRTIFHDRGRRSKAPGEPVTIFAYARDHYRNCWELVHAALIEIKRRHGDGVRIVAAGAKNLSATDDFIDMGLLDYRATGVLYREADIGITMQISRHPSYLPLELMASGVAMVAPRSRWFTWLFSDRVNSMLAMGTLADVVANLEELISDAALRKTISAGGLATIQESHSDWDAALRDVYSYLCHPE